MFIDSKEVLQEPINAARVGEILVTFIMFSTITAIFVTRLGNFP